ncbi:MAG TPA: phospholipase D-like domain-containing protein [Methylomirabilota bacterium]|nr:phospholipase D-like domain-containing protein [Methylomirabilota bacterium]
MAHPEPSDALASVRGLAEQAFSRAAGAPLVPGNRIRLLKDARENYPAWLDAIAGAKRFIHFESYIIHDDAVGDRFSDALIARARDGVPVRVIYDWMGGFGKTSRRFWRRLRAGGVAVRCYNAPTLASPLGWLSRDHRKMLAVDGTVGFVSGLCVGQAWVGDAGRNIAPWRDTGVEVRGPAVRQIDTAFAQMWAMMGAPIPDDGKASADPIAPAGDTPLRIVATVPNTAGLLRLGQLVAALARERLWLTDAYYAGTPLYAEGLRAAARDGVDVRLLVPNGTDIPLLRPLSKAGYRTLLEAGVRVFEWNGTMLHAKTAVADGRWARVGSTNLNPASWLGNCELDVLVEDERFGRQMEEMYVEDLANATEIILDERSRVRRREDEPDPATSGGGGSAGRAAAGLLRIGNTVGAAVIARRTLEPVETRIMLAVSIALLILATLVAVFPRLIAYPFAALAVWIAGALMYRCYRLRRTAQRDPRSAAG